MNLTTVHQSLQIVLGEAKTTTDCDITASWAEWTVGTTLLRSTSMVSAGTSAVTVVAAPPNAATWEQVKEIRLHNNDTVTHKVTLQLDAGGTPYIVLQSSVAADGDFVYTPDAGAAAGASGTVTDVVAGAGLNVGAGPGGSITNTGTLNVKPATTAAIGGVVIGSGITVNSGGTISSSGGGGGSYTAGLGIYITSSTIGNTGTIEQPAASGDALGIVFEAGASTASGRGGPFKVRSGDTTYAGAGSITSFGVDLRGGNVNLSDPTAGATGSYVAFAGGNIYGTAGYAYGGFFYSGNATLAGTASAIGATFTIAGGPAGGNDTNVGGGVVILGRSAAQQGGGIELYLGLGSSSGSLGIVNLGTGDPHVLNRAFLGVSNGVTLSAG